MSSYYTGKGGKQAGPFDEAEIGRQLAQGELSPTDLCWREGMAGWQPLSSVFGATAANAAPPPVGGAPALAASTGPLYLYVPIARVIILSIVSFGLYEAYWIYKNWRYLKEREGLMIQPFWRGIFGIFFCHKLFERIHEDEQARAVQEPTFSASGLATAWVVLIIISNLLSRAPSLAASIVAAFIPSFLCFVPVQRYINAVTEKRNPGQRYYGWSAGHIVCLVFGVLVWVLAFVGLGMEQ